MYESPIKIIESTIDSFSNAIIKRKDDAIFAEIQSSFGVELDRGELIRALQYDRDQYDKGYADGKRDAMDELVRCKDCTMCNYEPSNDSYRCSSFNGMHRIVEPGEYCSYGVRRPDDAV